MSFSIYKQNHKQWSLILGRFQCIPLHEGHINLIRKVLDEGKNVIVGLREADLSEENPYGWNERAMEIEKKFAGAVHDGRLKVVFYPDIVEIVHGRKVGWKVRQIKLPDEIEKISATEKREKGEG